MSKRYFIPDRQITTELVIKKSRFISYATYTPTVEAARTFIKQVRDEHPNRAHAVYAFAVGHGASVTHGMTDDGEPSGTAGRPTLVVVQGCGLGDITVVTVRYFGGIKLGTGGLVKAYTESAQLVLADLPTIEKVERKSVMVSIPYHLYEQFKLLVAKHNGQTDSETFATDVTAVLIFIVDDLPSFIADLNELTAGQVDWVEI